MLQHFTQVLSNFLGITFLGNTLKQYAVSLIIFLIGILFIKVLEHYIIKALLNLTKKTKNSIDDLIVNAIRKHTLPLFYYAAFYISIRSLKFSKLIIQILDAIGVAIVAIFIILIIIQIIDYALAQYVKKHEKDRNLFMLKGLLPAVKVTIWIIGIIFFLENLGFNVSTLAAGLGIGGVAIALGAQSILGDLFSYFSIIFDRPFELGDFIIIGDHMGTVEYIGIKTTRIRSLGGEQIVLSNTDLTGSRIRNYKRMKHRRIVFKLGLTYDTTGEQLKKVPLIIEKIIKENPKTTFDRAHFVSFDDFCLTIEVVYNVLDGDYNLYMDIQQEINLKIKEAFESHNLEFAFPTQTIEVKQK